MVGYLKGWYYTCFIPYTFLLPSTHAFTRRASKLIFTMRRAINCKIRDTTESDESAIVSLSMVMTNLLLLVSPLGELEVGDTVGR